MRFEHRFTVEAPQEAVAAFHASARGLRAITPPLILMQIHQAPEPLGEGDHLIFTLWIGPIPVKWDSLIKDVSVEGFTDTIGAFAPFAHWEHRHNFIRLDEHHTEVFDAIEARLKLHLIHGPIGLAMWLGNPLLFWYRGWRTRAALERSQR